MADSSDPFAPRTSSSLNYENSQDSYQDSQRFSQNDNFQEYHNSEEDDFSNGEVEHELTEDEKKEIDNAVKIATKAILVNSLEREAAIEEVISEGYSREEAEMAVNAVCDYIKEHPESVSDTQSKSGVGTLIFGIVCLTAGILLTVFAVNNAIWYGAIIVGIIEIIRGLINLGK